MNIYYNNPQHECFYETGCPYKDTCPIKPHCPYCPHRQENSKYISQTMYGNDYIEIQGFEKAEQAYDPLYSQNYVYENYGHNNLYPVTNFYRAQIPEEYDNIIPEYNENGYINPNENINCPWDNNRMCMEQN